MAEYLPLFDDPTESVTRTASNNITGGRLVKVSGDNTVTETTAAADDWLGIAAFDTPSGGLVTVFSGGIQRPTASGAITAGATVVSAAGGRVAAGTGAGAVGLALKAAADGAPVEV